MTLVDQQKGSENNSNDPEQGENHCEKEPLDEYLTRKGEGSINMSLPPREVSSHLVFSGSVFSVYDKVIELVRTDGGSERIRRQLIKHDPCVVMLVHDADRDSYLLTREYRVGAGSYVNGLPAGFIDSGESPEQAALRELREETGVVPGSGSDGSHSPHSTLPVLSPEDGQIERVLEVYSSLGMSDELGYIMVIHLSAWHQEQTQFDPGEYLQSAWVTWDQLIEADVKDAKAVVAIQHEAIRRVRNNPGRASRI